MAVIYLRSTDGNDADDGSTWALAKATMAAAATAAGAGGTVWVSQVHAETQGTAITITSPGTGASPVLFLCGNDAAEPPTALATTATVSTTGNSSITITGFGYFYGITFNSGTTAVSSSLSVGPASGLQQWVRFDSCSLRITSTGNGSLSFGSAPAGTGRATLVELNNTTVSFAAAGQGISVQRAMVLWTNTASATLGTVPTTLIKTIGATTPTVAFRGVDLSAMSGNLAVASETAGALISLENCKLHASMTVSTGSFIAQSGTTIRLVNCDSGDTNYKYQLQNYMGTITHEATIVRTGGASDGTTGISRKMVSTANSKFYAPLELGPLVAWNESTSSLTVTVHIVTDNVTLTDAECWIEVEELGTSGYPLSVTQSDRAADILATPANQTTSTETWTTTGLGTPVKQKLNVTFTPAEKGPIKVRVMLAKASTTVYVCPKVEAS